MQTVGGDIIKELFTSLGAYNLRARISVGIIFISPWLLELYLLVPEIHNLFSTIIIAITSYGIANIVIVYSRIPGYKALKKCFPNILPAQQALLPSSTYIDSHTKQRYYQFLSKHVPGFEIYDTDEKMLPSASTAITWLIAQTKDDSQFPLIAEENINLGFSYNLLGLKPYGIVVSLIGIVFNGGLLYLHYNNIYCIELMQILAGLITNVLFLSLWIFIITQNLVKSCARKYARALLSACDSPHLQ